MSPANSITNVLAVARRVLGDPRNFRLSTDETLAMSLALDTLDREPPTAIPTELYEAARLLLDTKSSWQLRVQRDGILEASAAFNDAFNAFQTLFETEFPDGQN